MPRGESGDEMTVLESHEDAFGQALIAELENRMEGRVLMLEVDDGRSVPAMHPREFFLEPAAWAWWERDLLADLRGPALDLGCGAGRHLTHLQDRGLTVTGVDVSPGAVEVCRRRGAQDVRLADLRTPPDDHHWRAVLMMCGNFGLAGGWDETRALLSDLHRLCAPGAALIADSVDPTGNEDAASLAYRESSKAAGRHEGEVRLRLRFGEVATPYWSLLNLPPRDVESLVKGTGWTIERHVIDGIAHAFRLRRA
jgi:SAM-dependent methyltransferase